MYNYAEFRPLTAIYLGVIEAKDIDFLVCKQVENLSPDGNLYQALLLPPSFTGSMGTQCAYGDLVMYLFFRSLAIEILCTEDMYFCTDPSQSPCALLPLATALIIMLSYAASVRMSQVHDD